jgi:hypothetical protein
VDLIYRIYHPIATHFSQQPVELFPKYIIILGHEAIFNKYKKTELTVCILFDYN